MSTAAESQFRTMPLEIPSKTSWRHSSKAVDAELTLPDRLMRHSKASHSYERSLGHRWQFHPNHSLSPLAARMEVDDKTDRKARERELSHELETKEHCQVSTTDEVEEINSVPQPDAMELEHSGNDMGTQTDLQRDSHSSHPNLYVIENRDVTLSQITHISVNPYLQSTPDLHLGILSALKTLRDRLESEHAPLVQERCKHCEAPLCPPRSGHLLDLFGLSEKVLANCNLPATSDAGCQALAARATELDSGSPPQPSQYDTLDTRRVLLSRLLVMLRGIDGNLQITGTHNIQLWRFKLSDPLMSLELRALGNPSRLVFCVSKAQREHLLDFFGNPFG